MAVENELSDHLLQLEQALLTPVVRNSQVELKKLLAENFFEIGSSGEVLYKDEEITPSAVGEVRMVLSEFEIHPMSDDITLTTYRIYNELKQQYSWRSSIWKYNGERWQMTFHQGTLTSKPK